MRPARAILAIIALLTMTAAGCAGSRRAGSFAPDGTAPDDVRLVSAGLADHLQVSTDGVKLSGLGRKSASTTVRASSLRPLLVEYRFVFTDRSGAIVEPVMNWTMIRLEPGAPIGLQAAAPRDSAQDARLEIRWAR